VVTGNTNRKAAEKLNGDHSYCSQTQQLDFDGCLSASETESDVETSGRIIS